MSKENLFNDLISLSEETKTHLLSRLFGMFEASIPVTSEYFYTVVEVFVENEKRRNEYIQNTKTE